MPAERIARIASLLNAVENLGELIVSGREFTDEAFALLRIPSLTTLDLMTTGVTRRLLPHIADMASLKRLDLSLTKIEHLDEGDLAALSALESIRLVDVPANDWLRGAIIRKIEVDRSRTRSYRR